LNPRLQTHLHRPGRSKRPEFCEGAACKADGELSDGRVFVAEYKGDHLRNVPKEIEKGQVGKVWAETSGGKALFAMLFKHERGMNIAQQLDAGIW
jgi:hypothetical protein